MPEAAIQRCAEYKIAKETRFRPKCCVKVTRGRLYCITNHEPNPGHAARKESSEQDCESLNWLRPNGEIETKVVR